MDHEIIDKETGVETQKTVQGEINEMAFSAAVVLEAKNFLQALEPKMEGVFYVVDEISSFLEKIQENKGINLQEIEGSIENLNAREKIRKLIGIFERMKFGVFSNGFLSREGSDLSDKNTRNYLRINFDTALDPSVAFEKKFQALEKILKDYISSTGFLAARARPRIINKYLYRLLEGLENLLNELDKICMDRESREYYEILLNDQSEGTEQAEISQMAFCANIDLAKTGGSPKALELKMKGVMYIANEIIFFLREIIESDEYNLTQDTEIPYTEIQDLCDTIGGLIDKFPSLDISSNKSIVDEVNDDNFLGGEFRLFDKELVEFLKIDFGTASNSLLALSNKIKALNHLLKLDIVFKEKLSEANLKSLRSLDSCLRSLHTNLYDYLKKFESLQSEPEIVKDVDSFLDLEESDESNDDEEQQEDIGFNLFPDLEELEPDESNDENTEELDLFLDDKEQPEDIKDIEDIEE